MSGEKIIKKLCSSIRKDCEVDKRSYKVKKSFLTHLVDHVLSQGAEFPEFVKELFQIILFAKPCFKITSNKWHLFGISMPLRATSKPILSCIKELIRSEMSKNNKAARVFTVQVTERFHLTLSQCMYDYLIEQKLDRVFILSRAIEFLKLVSNDERVTTLIESTLNKLCEETRAHHIAKQLRKCFQLL